MSASVLASLKAIARKRLSASNVAGAVASLLKAAAILVFDGSLTFSENERFKRFLTQLVKTRISKGPEALKPSRRSPFSKKRAKKKKKTTKRKKTVRRRNSGGTTTMLRRLGWTKGKSGWLSPDKKRFIPL